MPRYFFNIVRRKRVILDLDGDTLRSDADAIRHAFMVAREMIEQRHFYPGQYVERWAFQIADAAGRHVAMVRFADPPKPRPATRKFKTGH
jgi:hypothetical protein